MADKDEKKGLRESLELDLSKLPVKETKMLLKALVEFSDSPSTASAVKLLGVFYDITRKLGLFSLEPFSKELAKKGPPDEPTRRKRR